MAKKGSEFFSTLTKPMNKKGYLIDKLIDDDDDDDVNDNDEHLIFDKKTNFFIKIHCFS